MLTEAKAWRHIAEKAEKEGFQHGICAEISNLRYRENLIDYDMHKKMERKVFPYKILCDNQSDTLPSAAAYLYPVRFCGYGKPVFKDMSFEEADTARIMLCELLAIECEEIEKFTHADEGLNFSGED